MATRLQDTYSKDIRPALVTRFGYTNPMQVPRLDKIVINMDENIDITNRDGLRVLLFEITTQYY